MAKRVKELTPAQRERKKRKYRKEFFKKRSAKIKSKKLWNARITAFKEKFNALTEKQQSQGIGKSIEESIERIKLRIRKMY